MLNLKEEKSEQNFVKREKKFDITDTLNGLEVKIVEKTENSLEFDLTNVDASLANAFRRIMLSEVPGLAIDKVFVTDNTSIIQDEVLCHRLGLIPINFDYFNLLKPVTANAATELEMSIKKIRNNITDMENVVNLFDEDCYLMFELDVHFISDSKNKQEQRLHVMSGDIVWRPFKNQQEKFASSQPPVIFEKDIVVAKLIPGQSIKLTAFARMGLGEDHAKFSPVSSAFYRFMPVINFVTPVYDELAEQCKSLFSEGVIELKKVGKKLQAVVANPRLDSNSRNVLSHKVLSNMVQINYNLNHFIFYIETVNGTPPETIFKQAVVCLIKKTKTLVQHLEEV